MGNLTKLFGCRTFLRVVVETGTDKSLDVGTYPGREGECDFSLMLVLSTFLSIRNVAGNDFIDGCSQGPDITLFHRNGIIHETLWSHISQSARMLIIVIILMAATKVRADTEVGDGIVVIVVNKYIGRFHILVNDGRIAGMEVSQSGTDVADEFP